jgi:hypothetical protein
LPQAEIGAGSRQKGHNSDIRRSQNQQAVGDYLSDRNRLTTRASSKKVPSRLWTEAKFSAYKKPVNLARPAMRGAVRITGL